MAAKEARTSSLATLDQSALSVTGDTLSESREPAIFEFIHLKKKVNNIYTIERFFKHYLQQSGNSKFEKKIMTFVTAKLNLEI